jgi:glyoxylase I family protein
MATELEARRNVSEDGPATGLRGVHHLALNTDDMKATMEFYCGLLGMPLVHTLVTAPGGTERSKTRGSPPFECVRHYFFDMGGDSLLAFFELPKGLAKGDRNALATMQHLSFAVAPERFDAILARVTAAGVKIIDGPFCAVPPTTWSFYFFDNNGIRLEISTNKAAQPGEVDCVRSCTQTRAHIRAELETLTDDTAWIERMVATVPDA